MARIGVLALLVTGPLLLGAGEGSRILALSPDNAEAQALGPLTAYIEGNGESRLVWLKLRDGQVLKGKFEVIVGGSFGALGKARGLDRPGRGRRPCRRPSAPRTSRCPTAPRPGRGRAPAAGPRPASGSSPRPAPCRPPGHSGAPCRPGPWDRPRAGARPAPRRPVRWGPPPRFSRPFPPPARRRACRSSWPSRRSCRTARRCRGSPSRGTPWRSSAWCDRRPRPASGC